MTAWKDKQNKVVLWVHKRISESLHERFSTLIATSWSYSTLQEVKWGWYEPQLHIVRWCNGSTTDFDSVCFGSSPGLTTRIHINRDTSLGRNIWINNPSRYV